MTLPSLLLVMLLGVVALLVGAGVLALLLHRPSWSAPLAGAFAAMAFMTTIVGLAVAATTRG
ncbi:hypothetical protein [Streptomyces sp. NPDC037389]|uniref:hypothetical protein n=1 Tax=Streptomyces sp. NPDC037389 TaxID=3155369 RepID=UPI0033EEFE07